MNEHLHYDFNDDKNLILDVPHVVYNEVISGSKVGQILELPERAVFQEDAENGVRFVFDKEATRKKRKEMEESNADEYLASQWYYTLNAIADRTPVELRDPALYVAMSHDPLDDRSYQERRGMTAELAWPMLDDERATIDATIAMRATALTFGYLQESIIDSAYAHVSREHGVTLEALDMGACDLTTDGFDYARYEKNADRIKLHGHNLYNRQVMLTCFAGLVAISRLHTIHNREDLL